MNRTQQLSLLINNCPGIIQNSTTISNDVCVNGVEFDSRKVQNGSIFVAVEGEYFDGHDFIQKAFDNGALLVFGTQSNWSKSFPKKYIQVENSRLALAYLSAAFYGFPARKMRMIGVTGTDGKTTTVNLIYEILKAAGLKVGMISTVNAVVGDETIDTGFHVTTPEAPMIQELLAKMVDAGLTHVVLETTSHGLAQHRVAACEYDVGVITNITHEHLDYHGNYADYVAAKARLLLELEKTQPKAIGNVRLAVLNYDDISYQPLLKEIKDISHAVRVVAYSREEQKDIYLQDAALSIDGIKMTVGYENEQVEIASSLMGEYNISNILAAVGAAGLGLGISGENIGKGIKALLSIPGRMEKIDMGQDFSMIVDFAHTPNAMKVTLETCRQLTKKRVIAVFGSAGLRDREKRKLMAVEGVKNADVCVFTAEDPRTEKLSDILAEMTTAAKKAGGVEGKDYFSIEDRGAAIMKAIKIAQKGDLVVVCGKGHEQSMCFETTEYPWDDRIAVKAALASFLGVEGPDMPYLPTQE